MNRFISTNNAQNFIVVSDSITCVSLTLTVKTMYKTNKTNSFSQTPVQTNHFISLSCPAQLNSLAWSS